MMTLDNWIRLLLIAESSGLIVLAFRMEKAHRTVIHAIKLFLFLFALNAVLMVLDDAYRQIELDEVALVIIGFVYLIVRGLLSRGLWLFDKNSYLWKEIEKVVVVGLFFGVIAAVFSSFAGFERDTSFRLASVFCLLSTVLWVSWKCHVKRGVSKKTGADRD